MRTLQLIRLGFGRAWRIKGPVLLIGLVNLALALLVTGPVHKWFSEHINRRTDALQLLDGPQVRFLSELSRYDRTDVYSLVGTSFFWTALAGFFIAVFLGAGLFAVAARPDIGPRFPFFFASAARFFPRFLAMAVTVGTATLVVLFSLNVVLGAAIYRLAQQSNSEMLPVWLLLMQFAITGLFVLYAFLILDYGRIDSVVYPERPMLQALVTGFLLVSRRFVKVFGMAIVFLVLVGVLFAVYVTWRWAGSIAGTGAFLLTLLIQQVVIFGRYGLRAVMIGSEVESHAAWSPVPVALPDFAAEAEPARARREEQAYTRALRPLVPPRTSAVGALRRNLGLIRRRHQR